MVGGEIDEASPPFCFRDYLALAWFANVVCFVKEPA